MIIEVLGPAGAGKTTLVTALRRRDPGIVTAIPLTRTERVTEVWSALKPVLPHYVRHLREERFFSIEELRRVIYAGAWRRALERRDSAGRGAWVLDHGPVFMLGMLRAFGPPLTRCVGYRSWEACVLRSWARLLDIVVCLDAPDVTLVQRIETRSRAHCVKGRQPDEACEFLHRCRASFESILHELQRLGDPAVIRANTEVLDPAGVAEMVGRAVGLSDASPGV